MNNYQSSVFFYLCSAFSTKKENRFAKVYSREIKNISPFEKLFSLNIANFCPRESFSTLSLKKVKSEMWCNLAENINCILLQDKSGQLEEQREKYIFYNSFVKSFTTKWWKYTVKCDNHVTCCLWKFEQFLIKTLRRKIGVSKMRCQVE